MFLYDLTKKNTRIFTAVQCLQISFGYQSVPKILFWGHNIPPKIFTTYEQLRLKPELMLSKASYCQACQRFLASYVGFTSKTQVIWLIIACKSWLFITVTLPAENIALDNASFSAVSCDCSGVRTYVTKRIYFTFRGTRENVFNSRARSFTFQKCGIQKKLEGHFFFFENECFYERLCH